MSDGSRLSVSNETGLGSYSACGREETAGASARCGPWVV